MEYYSIEERMNEMSNQMMIFLAMAGYMLIVIGIGVFFARKANKNTENYFLGGRSLGPWVAAMSAEELKKVEEIVNEKIAENIDVVTNVMTIEEAKKICDDAGVDAYNIVKGKKRCCSKL